MSFVYLPSLQVVPYKIFGVVLWAVESCHVICKDNNVITETHTHGYCSNKHEAELRRVQIIEDQEGAR